MGEIAEHLLIQGMLGDPVMVVQTCLCSPADVEGAVDMGLTPLHDLTQLRPVVDILKVQMLHRSPRNDHAVRVAVTDLLEGLVKSKDMFLGHMACLVGLGLQEFIVCPINWTLETIFCGMLTKGDNLNLGLW